MRAATRAREQAWQRSISSQTVHLYLIREVQAAVKSGSGVAAPPCTAPLAAIPSSHNGLGLAPIARDVQVLYSPQRALLPECLSDSFIPIGHSDAIGAAYMCHRRKKEEK